MRAVRPLVVAVVVLVVLATPAVVLADGRVALVVGNSTYAHIGRLPNPDNDARDLSAALRRLGFEVTTELDADRVELTEALRAFTRQSAGADVSLVFYAGHGIEMDGVNYLVPVDARLERDVDVRFETVTVDDLLVSTSGTAPRSTLPGSVVPSMVVSGIPSWMTASTRIAEERLGRRGRGRSAGANPRPARTCARRASPAGWPEPAGCGRHEQEWGSRQHPRPRLRRARQPAGTRQLPARPRIEEARQELRALTGVTRDTD